MVSDISVYIIKYKAIHDVANKLSIPKSTACCITKLSKMISNANQKTLVEICKRTKKIL